MCNFARANCKVTGFSAVGSALRSGRRGRAFESPNPDRISAKGLVINPLRFVGGKEVGEKSAKFYSYCKILFNRAFHSKVRNV